MLRLFFQIKLTRLFLVNKSVSVNSLRKRRSVGVTFYSSSEAARKGLVTSEKSFSCVRCGAGFASMRQLAGHRAGKHRQHVGVRVSGIHAERLSEKQKGYIAAFLDGEGGIQITRSYRKDREYTLALHPAVYFTNTNEAVIRTIREWLGGGSITRRTEKGNHNDTFVLTISGVRSILQLLESIRPELIVKAKRADVMMEFCRSRLSHNRGKGRMFTRSELRLYSALRRLNQRGGAKKRQPTEVSSSASYWLPSITKAGKLSQRALESEVRLQS